MNYVRWAVGYLGRLGYVACAVILAAPTAVKAFDDLDTHPRITRGAIARSNLNEVLIGDLGLRDGIQTQLQHPSGARATISKWLEDASRLEDNPACRAGNHFHNPLKSFMSSGVTDRPFFINSVCASTPFATIISAVRWGTGYTDPATRGPQTGNPFDFDAARLSYFNALTLRTPQDREGALTQTFEALGHVAHLIQDMAVPAHTRNDFLSHLSFCVPRFTSIDRWCENLFERFVRRNREVVDAAAAFPAVTFDAQPPTRFWDIDQYTGGNPAADAVQGLAEYSNGNFASDNTIFTDSLSANDPHAFPYPRSSSTDLSALVQQSFTVARLVVGEDRIVDRGLYVAKITDGETMDFFAKATYLTRDLIDTVPESVLRLAFQLDDRVHREYAAKLLPRAIGYTRGLFEYFFRGRLDVDVAQADPSDPAIVRIQGTNMAREGLINGTLTLYADDPDGMRTAVAAVDATPTFNVTADAGGPVQSTRFRLSDNAERLVAVYKGTLGNEPAGTDPDRQPGAVIGKVLGGVRVEEIFSADGEWKIRTPRGVFGFQPPLAADSYEAVKWGDGRDLFVARTIFGQDLPNRVDVFSVPRLSNGVDLLTVDTGTGQRVPIGSPLRSAVLPAGGIHSGTVLNFSQPTIYRQTIVRMTRRETYVCEEDPITHQRGSRLVSTDILGPDILSSPDITPTFAKQIPFVLDAAHHFNSPAPVDYAWILHDVGLDTTGRIVGLVEVFAFLFPEIAPVAIQRFGLSPQTGDLVPIEEGALGAELPGGAGDFWVLVDLGAQEIITKSTEPVITASHVSHSIGDPELWTYLVRTGECDRTEPFTLAFPTSVSTGPDFAIVFTGDELESHIGSDNVVIDGLLRADLKAALSPYGIADVINNSDPGTVFPFFYRCTSDPNVCFALRLRSRVTGGVLPVFIRDARRAPKNSGSERIVLLPTNGGFGGIVAVLEKDPVRTTVRYASNFADAFDVVELGDVGTRLAIVTRSGTTDPFLPPTVLDTTVVSLDDSATSVVFPGVSLREDFTMLEPAYLYRTSDMKFYRLAPPLQQSALPASLAQPGESFGSYHTVRLP